MRHGAVTVHHGLDSEERWVCKERESRLLGPFLACLPTLPFFHVCDCCDPVTGREVTGEEERVCIGVENAEFWRDLCRGLLELCRSALPLWEASMRVIKTSNFYVKAHMGEQFLESPRRTNILQLG